MSGDMPRAALGFALCMSGKPQEGLPMIETAAANVQRSRPDSLESLGALTYLGDCQLALGRPVAVGDLELASLRRRADGDAHKVEVVP
jgi:hypothetical protein